MPRRVPESVWEMPSDFDWSPQAVCDYINRNWEIANSDEKGTLADLASGLYWYCSDYHGGQNSVEYSIMSAQLEYAPGISVRTVMLGGEACDVHRGEYSDEGDREE